MRRTIVFSPEFDLCVETLGGYRAVDQAISAVVDGLSKNPYGFYRFENDLVSFRYAITKPLGDMPPLTVIFTIEPDTTVTLQRVEAI